jgi:hypothetical protein
MPLVWRGFGIVVPIIFVLTGLLVSWISGDPDTRIGNPSFLGWTSMISGILLFLLGLVTWGGTEQQDAQGNTVRKKHDFFYVPILIWGVLLGGLSVYLLVFAVKAQKPAETSSTGAADSLAAAGTEKPATRTVNFYNPTQETLTALVGDEMGDGLIEKKEVAPGRIFSIELPEGDYLFSALHADDKTAFTFPAAADADDRSKYVLHEDAKGKFYQRILNPSTPEKDDYDEAWVMMDGKTGFLLVNVTTACDAGVTEKAIRGADWSGAIQAEYSGDDLMEPLYKQFLKNEFIKVVGPGQALPDAAAANEVYYLLVPFGGKGDKNTVITNAVVAAAVAVK